MATFIFPIQQTTGTTPATEATLLQVEQNTADTVTELQTANTALSSIDTKLTSPLAVTGPLTDTELRASAVPVSAASLPLPTGAATESTLAAAKSDLDTIAAIDFALEATQQDILADLNAIATVDFATEATLSSLNNKVSVVDTTDVTITASVLPTGAATAANQSTANSSLSDIDASLTTLVARNIATEAKQDNTITAITDVLTELELKANLTDTQPVSVTSLPLPTGAATAANQTTANASLSSIDSKLTSPLSVTGPLTDAQLRATPVPISGTITTSNNANGTTGAAVPANATQVAGSDGTNLIAVKVSATGVVSVDGSAVTQPVSAVSLPLPTGAATSANQTTANASLSSIDSKLTSPLSVTGPLTDTELRASAVPVSAALLPLPTGAATAAKQPALGTAGTASADVITVQGIASMTALKVDGSAVTQPVAQAGRVRANTPSFNDYSSTAVTTAAYVQLVASTSADCVAVEVYNQSASSIYFATGAAASESNQFIIPPGGNGLLPISIASGTRISVKAVDVNATAGSLIVNYWG